jgi:hypothetical protein
LHVWWCFVYVDTFCWTPSRRSFVLYYFWLSNLHPFGFHLVAIHLHSSIFNSPTFASLDLVIKLVHYVGFWLCIFEFIMYTRKSTLQVDGILYACTRFVVSKVHFGRIVVAIMVVIVFLWLCLAWRFSTCVDGKH